MGAWDELYPEDTLAANGIHTYIQGTKQDIIERLWAYNGNNYEHSVFGSGITGRHLISSVGFLKILSDYFSIEDFVTTNYPGDGSIFTDGTSLYLSNEELLVLASTTDHGLLSNLDKADHPQYMDTLGERSATGDWSLTAEDQLNETTFGTSSSDSISSVHSSLSWYAAHGANSLWQRHFDDASVSLRSIAWTTETKYLSRPPIVNYYYLDEATYRYSGFPAAVNASSGALVATYYSGHPVFCWSSGNSFYSSISKIINGAST